MSIVRTEVEKSEYFLSRIKNLDYKITNAIERSSFNSLDLSQEEQEYFDAGVPLDIIRQGATSVMNFLTDGLFGKIMQE